MGRVAVHRQQAELDVVGGGDGAAGAVLVDIADGEILEIAAIARNDHSPARAGGEGFGCFARGFHRPILPDRGGRGSLPAKHQVGDGDRR
jgi:sugar/nucleoside kinase (ribokinase family)